MIMTPEKKIEQEAIAVAYRVTYGNITLTDWTDGTWGRAHHDATTHANRLEKAVTLVAGSHADNQAFTVVPASWRVTDATPVGPRSTQRLARGKSKA